MVEPVTLVERQVVVFVGVSVVVVVGVPDVDPTVTVVVGGRELQVSDRQVCP